MEEQFLKTIEHWEKVGWITVNKKLNKEVLAKNLVDSLQDMPLRSFVETFSPNGLI